MLLTDTERATLENVFEGRRPNDLSAAVRLAKRGLLWCLGRGRYILTESGFAVLKEVRE